MELVEHLGARHVSKWKNCNIVKKKIIIRETSAWLWRALRRLVPGTYSITSICVVQSSSSGAGTYKASSFS